MCQCVADSAAKLRILEVISESATNNIYGSLTVIGGNKWSDIINHTLTVIVEVAKALLDTLKLDRESNGTKVIVTKSMLLLILFVMQASSLVLVNLHWTFDKIAMHRKRSHFNVVKDTENSHIVLKAITSNLDELIRCIIWSTLRERAVESIVIILELTISEVDTIERQVDENFIATAKSRW